jgi:predicted O-methyltransferase YrrM
MWRGEGTGACQTPSYPNEEIGALAAALKPRVSFEIGTYLGLSALTIALNTPEDATIYTVDLPEGFGEADLSTLTQGDKRLAMDTVQTVGRALVDHPAAEKVRQIRCNSTALDVGQYVDRIDLALIDGGHSYELVRNDTEKCLPHLAAGGMMVWDDYRWNLPGVSRYLRELQRKMPLRRIAGTQYVVYSERLAGR